MPKGCYPRKPRVPDGTKREVVICEVCGTPKVFLRCFLQINKTRCCSRRCAGIRASRKADAYTRVDCGICGKSFTKRKDHLKQVNYCSQECAAKSRRRNSIWSETSPDREARRRYFRKYDAVNRAKVNALHARWAREHRDVRNRLQLLRRAAGKLTQREFEYLWKASKGKCACCSSTDRLQVDHIVPVSKGGRTELANLQILCKKCNVSKGNR